MSLETQKQQLKYIFAPAGVAVGIAVFITLSMRVSTMFGIGRLSSAVTIIPRVAVAAFGAALLLYWLPIFIAGIYALDRRGAVGQSETLRTGGIYKYVRNPMYSGISFSIIGFGLMLDSGGVALAGALWLILAAWQSKREERELTSRFGSTYSAYRDSTPMLFPGLISLIKDTMNLRRSGKYLFFLALALLILVTGYILIDFWNRPDPRLINKPNIRAAIYAAAVRRIYLSDSSFGPNPRFSIIYLKRTTDDAAFKLVFEAPNEGEHQNHPLFDSPARRLPLRLRRLLADLRLPVKFVGNSSEVTGSPETGSVVKNNGVFVSVSNIQRLKTGQWRIAAHIYRANLGASWVMYEIHLVGDKIILRRTGPMAVS